MAGHVATKIDTDFPNSKTSHLFDSANLLFDRRFFYPSTEGTSPISFLKSGKMVIMSPSPNRDPPRGAGLGRRRKKSALSPPTL